jgi:predicted Rossmann fold flavoprotein
LANSLEVVVIGGGAAGFFGAITCAIAYPHSQVTLLEAGHYPLAKVRISGGGRCNVTHHCFEPTQLVQYYPRGSKALRGAFTRFQPKDTIAWFEARGVRLKTEADGRVFPMSDSSATIVNCLMAAATQAGVRLRTGVSVKSVGKIKDFLPHSFHPRGNFKERFEVVLKDGEILNCDRLLIATGSNPSGYRWVKEFGHAVEPPVPSLFTFNISDPRLQGLAGVSVDNVSVRLLETGKTKLEQIGPLLITHWGMSGPAILKLSAWGARKLHEQGYQMTLLVNWLPQYNPDSLREQLLVVKSQNPRKQIAGFCPFPLPRRLWQQMVTFVGISAQTSWTELSKQGLNQLSQELTQGHYQIQGKGVFKEEFVTCGGVNLAEVNFKTMESKLCPGLYFAGEILDIDGITGGFNFQSAWTTAWLAGQGMGNGFSS